MVSKEINNLNKEELLRLIETYAKNWLAMDGVWFQSIEDKFGVPEAIEHDKSAWRRFAVIEANRIKEFLMLPEQTGLKGLAEALKYRMYADINEDEIIYKDNTLIYRTLDCRVQNARKRKGMEYHPSGR